MKKLLLATSLLVGAAGVTTVNTTEVEATQVETTSYKVTKGDTYYSIARKTGTHLRTLQMLNATPHNKLRIGQRISVARTIEDGAKSWVYILDVDKKRNRMTVQLLGSRKMFYIYAEKAMIRVLDGYQYSDRNIATVTVLTNRKNDTKLLSWLQKGMN